MPKRLRTPDGFSFIELLVAMVFTAILMAGMAKVFQSSLGTFYTAGEKLSSSRRNRLSLDLLYDDLNAAGMLLVPNDIAAGTPQSVSVGTSSNPLFMIVPNVAVTIPKADVNNADLKVSADQILLYQDDSLPFEGTLNTNIAGSNGLVAAAVGAGTTASVPVPTSFDIVFSGATGASQAAQVTAGMVVVFKDSLAARSVGSANPTGATVTITPSATTVGSAGTPTGASVIDPAGHMIGSKVMILRPAQQVRYSIQPQFLDPQDATKAIPCLVREQENYVPAGFQSYLKVTAGGAAPTPPADYTSIIVAENVTSLKFYLSLNPGDTVDAPAKVWAGYGFATATKDPTIDSTTATSVFNTSLLGIGASPSAGTVSSQLATYGVPGFTTLSPTTDPTWFRDIPVAVRADLTTRTAVARTEYNQTTSIPTLTYNTHQETLVLVPRHFGLTLR